MTRTVDLDQWPRRAAYEFFRGYEQPFFSVTVELDVTAPYAASRSNDGIGFFLRAAHRTLRALQEVPELRYRMRGDRVVEHPVIHLGATVLRPDDTFAFCFLDYSTDLEDFAEAARYRLEDAKHRSDWAVQDGERDDVAYLTTLPWISFTSFDHAYRQPGDSVPRLVFGRHRASGGRRLMPFSLSLHHALADGIHAGRFLEHLEESMR